MKTIKVLDATEERFKKFGWIISEPDKQPDEDTEHVKYWDRVFFIEESIEELNVGYMTTMKIPPICTEMELMPTVEEFYMCLDGEPAIVFVAPGSRTEPDLSNISAFNLKGKSYVICRGIWHLAPIPLYNNSNYAVFTSGGCLINIDNELTINPDVLLFSKLKEEYTVNINELK